jgi:adenylosuccinate lyase
MREGKANNLLAAISADARIPLDAAALAALIKDPIEFTGDARQQITRVIKRVETITKTNATAAKYKPGSIR